MNIRSLIGASAVVIALSTAAFAATTPAPAPVPTPVVKPMAKPVKLTGAQIATLGDVPDGNQIFLEVPGPGDDLPIGRHEAVELRPGMRFYDVPVGSLG